MNSIYSLSQLGLLEQRKSLSRNISEDFNHAVVVSETAMALFDQTQSLHGLDSEDRFMLECACLLHDVGSIKGRKNHHLHSLQIIIDSPVLSFSDSERMIIGCITRYHRKSLPASKDVPFSKLSLKDQEKVCILASLLKLADGLDYMHEAPVVKIQCEIKKGKIILRLSLTPSYNKPKLLLKNISRKSDLAELTFKRPIAIEFINLN